MAEPKPVLCGVCGLQPKKYKCPTCAVVYCSAPCFKAHKDGCVKPAETSAATTLPPATDYNDDDGDSLINVPEDRLKRLLEAPDIRQALRDPRLQRVLRDIDGAPDRVARLEHYRTKEGREFVELLDKMLIVMGYAERTSEGVQFTG